jgi:hypothetical protein
MDFGLSFVQPNWYYNVALQNRGTLSDIRTHIHYQLAPLGNPGFYGGTYDDASTLSYTWTERTAVPRLDQQRIDIDDTGTTAVSVTFSGGPYISTTGGGGLWTQRTVGMNTPIVKTGQVCVARSNQSILYCAVEEDAGGTNTKLYKSTDGGLNWTVTGSPTLSWGRIKCNYNGSIVIASEISGSLYVSRNGGTTWQPQSGTGSHAWNSLYLSDDGRVLVAGVAGGFLYVSVNSGANWTPRGPSRIWQSVSGSSDGSTMCATAFTLAGTTPVFLSSDFGTTWAAPSSPPIPSDGSSPQSATSINGNKFAVVQSTTPGFLYVSQDGGVTWARSGSPVGQRLGVAMTPDGTTILLGGAGGTLYSWTASGS